MKMPLLPLGLAATLAASWTFRTAPAVLPAWIAGYNAATYPSVLAAARGVGLPFLLWQSYVQQPGITPSRAGFVQDGVSYGVQQDYINPNATDQRQYYVGQARYAAYGIRSFRAEWPTQVPNVFFNARRSTFVDSTDCVGYGSRLLSVVGNPAGGATAYDQLRALARQANQSPFAATGYVCSAYECAVALPLLPSGGQHGWQYVSGNVLPAAINQASQQLIAKDKNPPKLASYQARPRGGFGQAQPGDVLAYAFAPGLSSNGHFMVLEQAPRVLPLDSLQRWFPTTPADTLSKHRWYAVPVFDDTIIRHFRDSRARTGSTGIGHGTILVATDPSDVPVGFVFGPAKASSPTKFNADLMSSTKTLAIAVARYLP